MKSFISFVSLSPVLFTDVLFFHSKDWGAFTFVYSICHFILLFFNHLQLFFLQFFPNIHLVGSWFFSEDLLLPFLLQFLLILLDFSFLHLWMFIFCIIFHIFGVLFSIYLFKVVFNVKFFSLNLTVFWQYVLIFLVLIFPFFQRSYLILWLLYDCFDLHHFTGHFNTCCLFPSRYPLFMSLLHRFLDLFDVLHQLLQNTFVITH